MASAVLCSRSKCHNAETLLFKPVVLFLEIARCSHLFFVFLFFLMRCNQLFFLMDKNN